jgi:hypothetical protein
MFGLIFGFIGTITLEITNNNGKCIKGIEGFFEIIPN